MAPTPLVTSSPLIVSDPFYVSHPPTSGPVRILTLDGSPGGALRGLAQIKIVRALMKETWKLNHPGQQPQEKDIDDMRPCDHFNMIFGSGTGGAIAVYLGRLNLTIKECEEHYKVIGDEVYAKPLSNWNPRQRYNYDHERFERVLKDQTSPFLRDKSKTLKFDHQLATRPECKAAVLTKMVYSIQAVHVIKSYEANSGSVEQAIRATTASYFDFPNMKVGHLLLLGPDSGFNNPAGKAWNEATALYPQPTRGIWFISIGSGIQLENRLHPPVPPPTDGDKRFLAFMVSIRYGLRTVKETTMSALPHPVIESMSAVSQTIQTWSGYSWEFVRGRSPGRATELDILANKINTIHMRLDERMRRQLRDPEPAGFCYYRLNLRLREELFLVDAWNDNEELVKSAFSHKNADVLPEAPLMKDTGAASRILALSAMAADSPQRSIRILTLDGAPGGMSALVQLRLIRDLMKSIWKYQRLQQNLITTCADSDIDEMRPCKYFDLIAGSGTGGLIAIYLGRLRLTIKECETCFRHLGDRVYAEPFSRWSVWQRYNYDDKALEDVLKEQLASGEPKSKFCNQTTASTDCKVVVLASFDGHASGRILRSYRDPDRDGGDDLELSQVMRATMASHRDFAPVPLKNGFVGGLDATFSNPSNVALAEAEDLFGVGINRPAEGNPPHQGRGICIISIGNGLYPSKPALPSSPLEEQIQLTIRKLRVLAPNVWALLRGKLPAKAHPLRDLAMGCEHEHRKMIAKFPKEGDVGSRRDDLRHYFDSSQSKYSRFNIEDFEILNATRWTEANKALVEEWASREYLSDDIPLGMLNELESACAQL